MTALLIGVACSTALTKRMGKRRVFFMSMLLTGVFNITLFFIPASATNRIIGLEVLRQFAFGCSGPVIWSMMADVADYGEWKTGRRATPTVTSAVVFGIWVGLALPGAIAGWLLSLYVYQPNATHTVHSLLGIRLIASVYSGAAFLVSAVCLLFYGISMKLNLTISQDLKRTSSRVSCCNGRSSSCCVLSRIVVHALAREEGEVLSHAFVSQLTDMAAPH